MEPELEHSSCTAQTKLILAYTYQHDMPALEKISALLANSLGQDACQLAEALLASPCAQAQSFITNLFHHYGLASCSGDERLFKNVQQFCQHNLEG